MSHPSIRVTVLVENSVEARHLRAEHGLSYLIQAGDRQLLFDTGATDLLRANAQVLGLDLSRTDTIVLSHGHRDHTGGLPAVRAVAPQARVYLHPDALNPKYARDPDGSSRANGMLPECALDLRVRASLHWTDRPTEIAEGLFATGPIPRRTTFEDVGGPFFLDAECQRPDPLVDDQALYFQDRHGVHVLLGCAHAGVVNTLEYVRTLVGNAPLASVIGGMHLKSAAPARIEATVAALRALGAPVVCPNHCTGFAATAALWAAAPGRCLPRPTGATWVFERD